MRCIDCDFDLERISEPRCPECGRGFDPQDGGTFIGPGHTRFSRRLAQAPGWPMFVLASLVALLILASGFVPSAAFGAQISAVLAGFLLAVIYIGRVYMGLIGQFTLPRCRPRAVPIALHRWMVAPATVVLAVLLVASGVTRKAAFVLDRGVLEPIAQGVPMQPSAWSPVRTWSGSVAKGAVWGDVKVWAFDPESALGKLRDPFAKGPLSDDAWAALAKRKSGEVEADGTVDVRLARLAVFPIEGTGYGGDQATAWAYAPDAPDVFVHREDVYLRYSGDWYATRGWIRPLEDQP
jgi:hypothetical protein